MYALACLLVLMLFDDMQFDVTYELSPQLLPK